MSSALTLKKVFLLSIFDKYINRQLSTSNQSCDQSSSSAIHINLYDKAREVGSWVIED